ncbi:hypothetical protein [Streptacidiphilus sp. PAMC 29251]
MRRLLLVNFVPSALFIGCVLALARAGSFSGRSDWGQVPPRGLMVLAVDLLGISAGAAVLGLLLYPFQVRAVRVLEGYWDRWSFTAGLADVLAEHQRRRWQALHRRSQEPSRRAAEMRVAADAYRRLAARPSVDVLLPTALGNALRAGELSAGERYGLGTLASWPRIFPQVSDPVAGALRSTRDALDTAVNLFWSLLAVGAVSTGALWDEPGAWWLPALALVLAAVAYQGAVIAAQAYSGLMRVVYDLHRFDLLDALHHRLPSKEEERSVFGQVSEQLAGEWVQDLPYDHRR